MKKIIFAMMFVCLSVSMVQAQWGVQAGANFTTHKLFNDYYNFNKL